MFWYTAKLSSLLIVYTNTHQSFLQYNIISSMRTEEKHCKKWQREKTIKKSCLYVPSIIKKEIHHLAFDKIRHKKQTCLCQWYISTVTIHKVKDVKTHLNHVITHKCKIMLKQYLTQLTSTCISMALCANMCSGSGRYNHTGTLPALPTLTI